MINTISHHGVEFMCSFVRSLVRCVASVLSQRKKTVANLFVYSLCVSREIGAPSASVPTMAKLISTLVGCNFHSFVYLQIDNDILLRRSSSLRQGLPSVGVSHGRRKSSLEEIGISHFTTLMQATNHSNPIKISLNGSIGMEVGMTTKIPCPYTHSDSLA